MHRYRLRSFMGLRCSIHENFATCFAIIQDGYAKNLKAHLTTGEVLEHEIACSDFSEIFLFAQHLVETRAWRVLV